LIRLTAIMPVISFAGCVAPTPSPVGAPKFVPGGPPRRLAPLPLTGADKVCDSGAELNSPASLATAVKRRSSVINCASAGELVR
jgi:hypothetical protein